MADQKKNEFQVNFPGAQDIRLWRRFGSERGQNIIEILIWVFVAATLIFLVYEFVEKGLAKKVFDSVCKVVNNGKPC